MKLVKKVLAVALTGVMALGMLTACGDYESYSSLTDTLNTKLSSNYTYSIEATNVAKTMLVEALQTPQIEIDYDEDIADANKEEDADKKAALLAGAEVAYNRKLSTLTGTVGDYYGFVIVEQKYATEDEIVAAIASAISSDSDAPKTGFFGFASKQAFDATLDVKAADGTTTTETLKDCTVVVYVVNESVTASDASADTTLEDANGVDPLLYLATKYAGKNANVAF